MLRTTVFRLAASLLLLSLLAVPLFACTTVPEEPDISSQESTAQAETDETTGEEAAPLYTCTLPLPVATLTRFPVLVRVPKSALQAASDAPLTVTDQSGTALAYEQMEEEGDTVRFWILIPEYHADERTVLTFRAGGEGSPGSVWEDGYDLVLHLDAEGDGDSSQNRRSVSAFGSVPTTVGASGGAALFQGSSLLTVDRVLPLRKEETATRQNNTYTNTGYAKPTNWNYAQGLTTDGEYLYFAGHFDSVGKGASIHKIRISDMTEVAVFEHAGPMHSAILDFEPETGTIFASTGGDGRAAEVWELRRDTGECLGKWDLRTLGFGGGAGVISIGNREILLYTSAEDGAKIAFTHLRLSENGAYTVLYEWTHTDTDLGVGQGLDSLSRNGDGSFTVYYLADAGTKVSVDPHYIYQIRLTPNEPLKVEKRFHISITEETEGLAFLKRTDGRYDVYFGSNAERIYRMDATLDALKETPFPSTVSENAFTLSFFVRVDRTANQYPGIIGFGSQTNNKNRFFLHLFGDTAGKLRFGTCLDDVWTKLDTAGNALPSGEFHHVAAVYDGQTMKLYIDGSCVGTKSVSGILTDYGAPFSIGADIENGAPAYYFHGAIDEIRLVRAVRSAEWIMEEANQK